MKTKNRILKISAIVAIFFGSAFLSYSFVSGLKEHDRTTASMEQVLKEHCHCKDVSIDISSYGIQFNDEGVSNENVHFLLRDCAITSVKTEAKRVHAILSEKVPSYGTIDIVSFSFLSEEKQETIQVKNGILQL